MVKYYIKIEYFVVCTVCKELMLQGDSLGCDGCGKKVCCECSYEDSVFDVYCISCCENSPGYMTACGERILKCELDDCDYCEKCDVYICTGYENDHNCSCGCEE